MLRQEEWEKRPAFKVNRPFTQQDKHKSRPSKNPYRNDVKIMPVSEKLCSAAAQVRNPTPLCWEFQRRHNSGLTNSSRAKYSPCANPGGTQQLPEGPRSGRHLIPPWTRPAGTAAEGQREGRLVPLHGPSPAHLLSAPSAPYPACQGPRPSRQLQTEQAPLHKEEG